MKLEMTQDHDMLLLIAKVVASVSTAVVAVLAFVKWAVPWADKFIKRDTLRTSYEAIRATRVVLEDSTSSGLCHRAIVFNAHNCGGVPRPGRPFYVSAATWSLGDHPAALESHRHEKLSDYYRLDVDSRYIEMLVRVMNDGQYRFTTATHPDCLLRGIYHRSGVVDSIITFVGIRDNEMMFASFARYDREFTTDEENEVAMKTSLIRSYIMKH